VHAAMRHDPSEIGQLTAEVFQLAAPVMKSHAGGLADTTEVPQKADGIAAVPKTSASCQNGREHQQQLSGRSLGSIVKVKVVPTSPLKRGYP
jgi:hypothetical protein